MGSNLGLGFTHRLDSSFLGLPYRILNMTHKKELYTMESMGRVLDDIS